MIKILLVTKIYITTAYVDISKKNLLYFLNEKSTNKHKLN